MMGARQGIANIFSGRAEHCFWITKLVKLAMWLGISIIGLWSTSTLGSAALNAERAAIPERISFQNIFENKDITLGEGTAFLQDSEGFMWLGGSIALFRYDGYEFRQMDFVPDDTKPNERASVLYTEGLFEDSKKRIWIASRSGILKYDRETDKIIRLKNMPEPAAKIWGIETLAFIELDDGTILAGTHTGLFAINPVTLNYELIRAATITALFRNGSEIWLGTDTGLERLDWASKTFTEHPLVNGKEGVPIDHHVGSIISDKQGKLWIGTAGGLVHYDPRTKQWKRYRNDPEDPYSIGSNDIWRLALDSYGILWLATDGGGLVAFDQERNRFINHKVQAGRVGSIISNAVRAVYEDRNHDLWVGNYPAGVNFFDRSSAAITTYTNEPNNPNSLSNNSVSSVQEDKDGNLWLGTTGGGLNHLNRKTGKFTHFKNDPNNPNSLNGNSVTSMLIDSEGMIWTGCWKSGIASYNPATQQFTRYPFDPQNSPTRTTDTSNQLSGSSVWFIKEDKNHDLWLATHTSGISKLDRATKKFTHYTNSITDPTSLSNKLSWTMFEDSKGNFWVGTANGLNLMDRERGTFTRFLADLKDPTSLSHSSAITLYEDRKGRLWIGTDAGLNLFISESRTFKRYTKKDGFLSDHIRKILEDAEGNLWVSTDNGFSSFNPETFKIKNYNRIAGRLTGSFFTKSGLVSRSGEIIFGGAEGLRIFDPSAFSENKYIPPVVLTDFKIFSESVAVGAPDGILHRAINLSDQIELDYKKTTLAFKYAALNFRESDKNLYSYKLEGFDQDWSKPGNQRETKYTNLDPGTYVFKVKASNNDGLWNEAGKSVTVIQHNPPWRTWWAYLFYLIIALCLFSLVIYKQRQGRELMTEQNRILEHNVAARTAELREKSKDMQIILSNIPQGIFTVQWDGTIHPEYSRYLETIFETQNIAHRELSDFLFSRAKFENQKLKIIKSAMFSMIGEDEINFEFNHSKLPTEYEIVFDSNKKTLSLEWNPIIENGLVSRLMVSVRDISHIKQMEDNLIQSEKLAALGALVAGVSHELNTPIGNSLTVATSMRDVCANMIGQIKIGLTKATLEKYVLDMDEGTTIVTRNLEKASELITSFKQVASDRTSAQRRKFSLKEIINETCLTMSPAFKRTRYSVATDIVQDITLDSYPGPLGQVISNLLNNTIIHAFEGRETGRVLVSTKIVAGGVNIKVEDNGVGIAPEHHSKIFDPFFTTKLGSGGSGLGMHIVHNIVTGVLGGTILLESELDKGTCFTIFLPKAAPVVDPSSDDEIPR